MRRVLFFLLLTTILLSTTGLEAQQLFPGKDVIRMRFMDLYIDMLFFGNTGPKSGTWTCEEGSIECNGINGQADTEFQVGSIIVLETNLGWQRYEISKINNANQFERARYRYPLTGKRFRDDLDEVNASSIDLVNIGLSDNNAKLVYDGLGTPTPIVLQDQLLNNDQSEIEPGVQFLTVSRKPVDQDVATALFRNIDLSDPPRTTGETYLIAGLNASSQYAFGFTYDDLVLIRGYDFKWCPTSTFCKSGFDMKMGPITSLITSNTAMCFYDGTGPECDNTIELGSITITDTLETKHPVLLDGDAKVWNDLVFGAGNIILPGTVKNAKWKVFNSTGLHIHFEYQPIAANEQEIFIHFQTSHKREDGSNLPYHLHFYPSTADNCTFRMCADIAAGPHDVQIPASTNYCVNVPVNNEQNVLKVEDIGVYPGTGLDISSNGYVHLYRNSSNVADTCATMDVVYSSSDFHEHQDTLGSREEYDK